MGATCGAPGIQEMHDSSFFEETDTSGNTGGSIKGGTEHAFVREWQNGKEKAREWQKQIRQETRQLDRDMTHLRREEEKMKREMKAPANRGQNEQVKSMAKNIVRLRKSVVKLERTKTSMTAMNLQLTTQIAAMSSASAVKVSAATMKEANAIMNIQAMQKTMDEMQQEIAKAQLFEDVMEEALEDPDDETEVDSELHKVYEEVALDASMILGPSVPKPQFVSRAHAQAASSHQDPIQTRLPMEPVLTGHGDPMGTGLPSSEDDHLSTRLQALNS